MLVATEETRKSFYPTPYSIAEKMLEGIDWNRVESILEPSAGKGDLIEAVPYVLGSNRNKYYDHEISVDAVEIDPYLRGVIKHNFVEHKEALGKEWNALREKYLKMNREYIKANDPDGSEKERIYGIEKEYWKKERVYNCYSNINLNIVHDDFFSYDSYTKYDLILMNPPFSNGDQHLMRAIRMMERANGGEIRCLLNAETIRNPYTNLRKTLARTISKYNAAIEYVDSGFEDAERQTDVEIAIIKMTVPAKEQHSDILNGLKEAAAKTPHESFYQCENLSVQDYLSDAIARFKLEVDAGVKLIQEYRGMESMFSDTLLDDKYHGMTLVLRTGDDKLLSVNNYLKLVRLKYWKALFKNPVVTNKMTSDVLNEYLGNLNKLTQYDFTMFNIQQLFCNLNISLMNSIDQTIMKLFDEMSCEHSWYNGSDNIHYFNGWKTNKAHKINEKVILPCSGFFSSWSNKLDIYTAIQKISDIEKVFDYFDGNLTAPVNLGHIFQNAEATGNTRNLQCKYFTLNIYRKGTMHLKFTNKELLERYNAYCCKGKAWLPPEYGKASYQNMSEESRQIIDEFNGDGTPGSGKANYETLVSSWSQKALSCGQNDLKLLSL